VNVGWDANGSAGESHPRLRRAWILALIAALAHVVLSVVFASFTPYLQAGVTNGIRYEDIGAPDEAAHVQYVEHLLSGKGLPVLSGISGQPSPVYEFHQPPLAYAVAAGWVRTMGFMSVKTEAASIALRSINCLFGGITVLGVFWFAVWATKKPELSALAAWLAALLPMHCALSGAFSNDPLTFMFCTWTLAVIARWQGRWTWKSVLLAGTLIGMAVLTKFTGLLLVPAFIFSIVLTGTRNRYPFLAAGLAVVLLIAGPLLLRNQAIYGHPLALNVFYGTFNRDVFPAEVFSGARPLARWLYVFLSGTALSSVGIFGIMDIHLPYVLYIPLIALFVLGLVASVSPKAENRLRWPVGIFVTLLVLSFISYNLWQVQPQARYLFPAIAPLALWILLGLYRIGKGLILPMGLVVGLLVANFYALWTLPAEFELRTSRARSSSRL
jgi:4-amino-4-deoxy-L-arabinose transferase-like glycosyltransferase